ncbi:hypothetical protein ACE103_06175 [Bradyrhizobium sp. ma5]|uniref:hypothetical protein n=1 Tax=Bradyrhizobium sp. ma5 TaxID=3344828 RepID=UPI0035D4BE50
MTPTEFKNALRKLRLSVRAAAPLLGISLRQAQRYSRGEAGQSVSAPVANLLNAWIANITNLKQTHAQLSGMLDAIDRRSLRIRGGRKDETSVWKEQLTIWIQETEHLLRNRPPGLPSQNGFVSIGDCPGSDPGWAGHASLVTANDRKNS